MICPEAFLGFLAKGKADTKLTVVICCQIFHRKSVAPSNGDFGGDRHRVRPVDKIRNFETKSLSKIIVTPLPRPRLDFCECVTSMNFQ